MLETMWKTNEDNGLPYGSRLLNIGTWIEGAGESKNGLPWPRILNVRLFIGRIVTVCDSHHCEGLEYQMKEIRYSSTATICLGLGQSRTEPQFDINKPFEHYTVSFNDSLKEV